MAFSFKDFKASDKLHSISHSIDRREIRGKYHSPYLMGIKSEKVTPNQASAFFFKAPYKSNRMNAATVFLIYIKLLIFLCTLIMLAETNCFLEFPFPLQLPCLIQPPDYQGFQNTICFIILIKVFSGSTWSALN